MDLLKLTGVVYNLTTRGRLIAEECLDVFYTFFYFISQPFVTFRIYPPLRPEHFSIYSVTITTLNYIGLCYLISNLR